ncbi:9491_t:CDS:2 [Diversispora eburnea]|uniref:9491_t:CDS:1 n=1 Tax=Diversispora eburnea TaxID=1213867 RepID=A0A9N8UY60_9GLOM|nr:9491_t:CDS:2 [Diversispora eburnea]
MLPKKLKPRFKSHGLPIKINNELLAKQIKKLRVSNNSSNNDSNNAAAPSNKINDSWQTLSNARDNKNDITEYYNDRKFYNGNKKFKKSSLKNNNIPPKTNANSNKSKKTGKSVKFSLPDESQSNEGAKLLMRKSKTMSALNVDDTAALSLVKADPVPGRCNNLVKL